MRLILALGVCAAFLSGNLSVLGQEKERLVRIVLTVPSTAYKVQIKEIYQTEKELWVLSRVEGIGIGLTVITNAKDQVKVKAPKLPVKHFVLGKNWNWKREDYIFLKNRKQFDKMLGKVMAKRIYKRKEKKLPKRAESKTVRYIVAYKKEIFEDGKTKKGETLEELAKRHAKEFGGKFDRTLKIINGCVLILPRGKAKKLAQLPEVRVVEPDRVIGIPPIEK